MKLTLSSSCRPLALNEKAMRLSRLSIGPRKSVFHVRFLSGGQSGNGPLAPLNAWMNLTPRGGRYETVSFQHGGCGRCRGGPRPIRDVRFGAPCALRTCPVLSPRLSKGALVPSWLPCAVLPPRALLSLRSAHCVERRINHPRTGRAGHPRSNARAALF